MIKTYDRTPDLVYKFVYIAGQNKDKKLSEAVLTAIPLMTDTVHIDIYRSFDSPYSYERIIRPNNPKMTLKVFYRDATSYLFEPVTSLEIYIKDDTYFIAFQYQIRTELKWFVVKAIQCTSSSYVRDIKHADVVEVGRHATLKK